MSAELIHFLWKPLIQVGVERVEVCDGKVGVDRRGRRGDWRLRQAARALVGTQGVVVAFAQCDVLSLLASGSCLAHVAPLVLVQGAVFVPVLLLPCLAHHLEGHLLNPLHLLKTICNVSIVPSVSLSLSFRK